MEKIVLNVLSIVKHSLNNEKVGLVLFDKDNRKILYKRLVGFDENAHQNMRDLLEVVNFWDFQERSGKKSEILVLEELVSHQIPRTDEEKHRLVKIINFMNEEKIAVILPLNRKVQLNGLLLVGHKENDEAFTVQDIDLLESIVANASVAVGRALLYQDVHNLAENLEQKVKEATKELQVKIEDLETARKREQDLLDILGHELRTPLSIIKNAIGLIQIKKRKGVLTEEDINKNIDAADESLERELKIVDTLLGATKLEANKLELHLEQVDIIDVIEDGISAQKRETEKKGLKVTFNKPQTKVSMVYADRTKIQEVFDNLLSNAVKYTEKGGIEISLLEDQNFAYVTIKDTGVGIPKEDIEKLGTKFYRVRQYSQEGNKMRLVRPGGSGLGLYVTFGYVRAMGGDVKVESKLSKGSTFTFSIPKYKNQKVEDGKSRRDEKDVFKRMGLK
jgi:signal transduction histidine kinase